MFSAYYLQIMILVGINIIMATSLNLITGFTGQLSIGHAAFMSIGAYAAALATLKLGLPFFASLLFGALTAAFFGVLIGIPTLKLRGDYLAIATLGFGEIVRIVFLNLKITGGAVGLRGIPKNTTLLWVVIAAILTLFILSRILKSRVGRALVAIREDETAAESMGINTTYFKPFKRVFVGPEAVFTLFYIFTPQFYFLRLIEHLYGCLGGLGRWARLSVRGDTAIPELFGQCRLQALFMVPFCSDYEGQPGNYRRKMSRLCIFQRDSLGKSKVF